MDRKDFGKVLAGIVMLLLTIAVSVATFVFLYNTNQPSLGLGDASASFQNTVRAATFSWPEQSPERWFVIGGTIGLYGAGALFIAGLILVFVKRSVRFIFLPISGVCALSVATFVAQAVYEAHFVLNLELIPVVLVLLILGGALLVLGVASFVLGIVFPRRLVRSQEDGENLDFASIPTPEEEKVEPTPVEDKPEEKEGPKPEELAEKEEVEKPEFFTIPEEEDPSASEEKPAKSKAPAKKGAAPKAKATGKYEVYPEAGFFKYRLKANNGEILIVSNPYRTKESALAGIETLKKNLPLGNSKVTVDKNGFAQFQVFTGNDSRLVVAGEIYPTLAGAEKALVSAINFCDTDRIQVLEEIPEAEHREWHIDPEEITPSPNGKLVLELNEGGKAIATLLANNGEPLFVTATYSTKAALKKALSNIRAKLIEGKNLTVAKDKQNRYQFRLYSDNGMVLIMGHTYGNRDAATRALQSARNFIRDAKITE